jgi:hypothetical protein
LADRESEGLIDLEHADVVQHFVYAETMIVLQQLTLKLPAASTRLWPTCDGPLFELLAPKRPVRMRS